MYKLIKENNSKNDIYRYIDHILGEISGNGHYISSNLGCSTTNSRNNKNHKESVVVNQGNIIYYPEHDLSNINNYENFRCMDVQDNYNFRSDVIGSNYYQPINTSYESLKCHHSHYAQYPFNFKYDYENTSTTSNSHSVSSLDSNRIGFFNNYGTAHEFVAAYNGDKIKNLQPIINIAKCRTDNSLIEKCIKLLKWHITSHCDSDIYWTSTSLTTEQVIEIINRYKSVNYNYIMINRYPNMHEITRKSNFSELMRYYKVYNSKDFNGYPSTFRIPEDKDIIINILKCKIPLIFKPSNGSMGNGIKVVTIPEEYDSVFEDYVAQEYITNPLLINGKKFDIRIYILITSIGSDYKALLYELSLVRVCTEIYRYPCTSNTCNNYIHLTNYSINKSNTLNYHRSNDIDDYNNNKLPLSIVLNNLSKLGYDKNDIWKQITEISTNVSTAIYPQLLINHKTCSFNTKECNYFQILGLDVILDVYGKAWLLEVNSNPSLKINYSNSKGIIKEDPVDHSIKFPLLRDSLTIIHQYLEGIKNISTKRWCELNIEMSADFKGFLELYIKAKNDNWKKHLLVDNNGLNLVCLRN